MHPNVDEFLAKEQKWPAELEKLRMIILDCGLMEELKWGVPCYTFKKANVVLIHGFKEYCAIAFFKGALLSDTEGILIQQTQNVQAGRQVRFSNLSQISAIEAILKAYIFEAIEIEKEGLVVVSTRSKELEIPQEFQLRLNASQQLKSAFEALTPGRQRAYCLYFSEPKQSKTREARIEKYIDRILIGKGFTDCVCGLSKRMPGCDGSHKHINKENI